tara:strand:- start:277 stop:597 length:321 start_codon:yes stop_codon:yes gene_type:complete
MTIKLHITDREDNEKSIEVSEGTTIKEAIEDNISPDNFGICGGSCACGTCHVYVNPNDFDKLLKKNDEETSTLESLAIEPTQYSRLGCQVELKKDHDNITITIAPD